MNNANLDRHKMEKHPGRKALFHFFKLNIYRELALVFKKWRAVLEIISKLALMFILYYFYLILAFFLFPIENAILLQNIIMVSVVFTMVLLFERKKEWSLGIKDRSFHRSSAYGMILGIVLISIVFILLLLGNGVEISGIKRVNLLYPFLTFIGVAISEELLVRGYIQGLVGYSFGKKVSWLFPSILFALLHGSNPNVWDYPFSMLNLFLAGYLLAIYRDLTGSLWGPIGFHLTWNFFQGCIYGFRTSGLVFPSILQLEPVARSEFSGGNFGAEGSIITTVVLFLMILWLLKMYRKKCFTANK